MFVLTGEGAPNTPPQALSPPRTIVRFVSFPVDEDVFIKMPGEVQTDVGAVGMPDFDFRLVTDLWESEGVIVIEKGTMLSFCDVDFGMFFPTGTGVACHLN